MSIDWRNPFENFRDKYCSFSNVKAYKLWLWRYNYVPFSVGKVGEYMDKVREQWAGESVPLGHFFSAYRDMGVKDGRQPWITKFFNAKFSLHIGVSIWKGWLPLPYIGIVLRYSPTRYFQFGGIFAPEGAFDSVTETWERATLCGKFRWAEYKSEYYKGGNYDVLDNYEGLV